MFLSVFLIFLVLVIIGIALQRKNDLEKPMTQLQELFGYPGTDYTESLSEFKFVQSNTRAFVVMSTVPGMAFQAQKALQSVPHSLQIRRCLVVPENTFSNQEMLSMESAQVIPAKFEGPLGKYLTITDPTVSSLIGLNRSYGSHDILLFLDDDMYYHKQLIQDLITGIEESHFSKVVVVRKRSLKVPAQDSKYGVAMPASLWTSAFRGDVLHLIEHAKTCHFSDDIPIAFALRRMNIEIIGLQADARYVKVSSREFKTKRSLHDDCFTSLQSQFGPKDDA